MLMSGGVILETSKIHLSNVPAKVLVTHMCGYFKMQMFSYIHIFFHSHMSSANERLFLSWDFSYV